MRQFAVIGLGRFGSAVATKLVENGCEVLAIDKDEERVRALRDTVQTAVIGDATERKTLEALQLTDLDGVVLCLGDHMDASILAALYLRELGVKNIWAKAISEDHAKILNTLGVRHTVLPERDTAHRLADELTYPNMIDFIPLHGGYSITQIAPPAEFIGKSLRELNLRAKYGIQVIAVREVVPERVNIAPDGDFVIKDSDVLVVLGRNEDIERLSTSNG